MSRRSSHVDRLENSRTWLPLIRKICEIKNLPIVQLPVENEQIHERCLAYNQLVLDRVIDLLSMSEETDEYIEKNLRDFIASCSNYTLLTSLDWSINFNLPANRALFAAQEYIAKPDEIACLTLRPTLQKIIGTAFPDTDLKSASENSDGEFIPSNFVPDAHREVLIAVSECYEYTAENTRLLFPQFKTEDSAHADDTSSVAIRAFDMTDDGRQRLRVVAGEASITYFDALEKMHYQNQHRNPFSFGFLLEKLGMALLKSSVANNGSELDADFSECRNPIAKCYVEWRKLSVEVKEKIKNYQIKNTKCSGTLEDYLLVLFASIMELPTDSDDEKIIFTDQEEEQIKIATIRTENNDGNSAETATTIVRIPVICAEQFGNQIGGIVDAHPDLSQIPLFGKQDLFEAGKTAEPIHPETLDVLADHFKVALQNRPPLSGINDQQLISYAPFFELVIDYYCFRFPLYIILSKMRERNLLVTAENLGALLLLFPTETWRFFLNSLTIRVVTLLTSRTGSVDGIDAFLKIIPNTHWILFFNIMSDIGLSELWECNEIAALMYQFPQKQWKTLVCAMAPLIRVKMRNVNDICEFLEGHLITEFSFAFSLIVPLVEHILVNRTMFGRLLSNLPPNMWSSVVTICTPIIENIQKDSELIEIMSSFGQARSILFLELLSPWVNKIAFTQDGVKKILDKLATRAWGPFFSILTPEKIAQFISSVAELIDFLNLFSCNLQARCFYALAFHLPKISLNYASLQRLITEFPTCINHIGLHFLDTLPKIFSQFVVAFSLEDELREINSRKKIDHFLFLVDKMLPFLLFSKNLFFIGRSNVCDLDLERSAGLLPAFYADLVAQFRTLEEKVILNVISPVEECKQKLELLIDFIDRTNVGEFSTESLLFCYLLDKYPEDLLKKIYLYLDRFVVYHHRYQTVVVNSSIVSALSIHGFGITPRVITRDSLFRARTPVQHATTRSPTPTANSRATQLNLPQ